PPVAVSYDADDQFDAAAAHRSDERSLEASALDPAGGRRDLLERLPRLVVAPDPERDAADVRLVQDLRREHLDGDGIAELTGRRHRLLGRGRTAPGNHRHTVLRQELQALRLRPLTRPVEQLELV